MFKQLFRYMTLSTALLYNACLPPEEDLESSCQGDVLFEDDFEGEELDKEKWENNCTNVNEYSLQKGILEMRTENACILQSRSRYTLDDRTLCFEARWKVGEREGTAFFVGLSDAPSSAYNLLDNKSLFCGNSYQGDVEENPCDTNVENWQQTRIEMTPKGINYYLNGELNSTLSNRFNNNQRFIVDVSCESDDKSEKTCYLDKVRIVR